VANTGEVVDGRVVVTNSNRRSVEVWMKWLIRDSLYQVIRCSGLMPLFRTVFGGSVVLIVFHEIQADHHRELMTGTPVSFFERTLCWLRQNGWEFVRLEEGLERLDVPARHPRSVVLTFDDAYRDNVDVALPILERHRAPFIVYTPTAALTRDLQVWWIGLRELVRSRAEVTIDAMERRFRCPDYRSKLRTMHEVSRWVHQDYRRIAALNASLIKAGVSYGDLNAAYFLSQIELRALSRHPLASIGGHTTSHPALAALDDTAARAEIADNRIFLEHLTDRPVRHFAYPYGTASSFGARDLRLAREAGFETAVSARHGHVRDCDSARFALPRICLGGRHDTTVSLQAKMNAVQSGLTAIFDLQRISLA
jgi:peptidoglycan/xylan/chitin deacetylase (PgdA/CDA1 family)